MKNKLVFLMLLVFVIKDVCAQIPNWTQYLGRKTNYPEEVFFTGFMSLNYDKGSDLESLKERSLQQAKVQLSENIKITIESKILNTQTNRNSNSVEEFEKVSTSYSSLDISQLSTDVYVNDRKREIMAFAWVKKEQVIITYQDQIKTLYDKIENQYQLAVQQSDENKNTALKSLFATNKLFRKIEEAQSILVICGMSNTETPKYKQIQELKLKIDAETQLLKKSKDLTISELSAFLSTSLMLQFEDLPDKFLLKNITYRESEMCSEFSERFTSKLRIDLIKDGFPLANKNAEVVPELHEISGTYWEDEGDKIQVLLSIVQKNKGNETMVAAAEGWTTKEHLMNSSVSYRPSNYFDAHQKKNILAQGRIQNGGAKLELWTNHGEDGLIFREGQTMRMSIRSNRVGYVRLVNYWADGTKLLLMDNYYIDHKKVNRIIQLPFEWEVGCPCGAEFLQANIQNTEFSPLKIKEEDGFEFILESIDDVVSSNKANGLKSTEAGGFTAEKRLVLTTIE